MSKECFFVRMFGKEDKVVGRLVEAIVHMARN